jgi:hypothetical protein
MADHPPIPRLVYIIKVIESGGESMIFIFEF